MTRGQIAFWALFAVTMLVYLSIVLWSLPLVAAAAGGLAPFDLRPGGYSSADARAFLAALSDTGREWYLGAQARLDLVYPALLALVLGIALWVRTTGIWRAVLVPVPVATSAFDYLENLRVRAMLIVPPDDVSEQMIESADFATRAKSTLTTLAAVAFLIAVAVRWYRRRGMSA